MLVWNAIWENPGGKILTNTLPLLRIICRFILTGKIDNSFNKIGIFLPVLHSSECSSENEVDGDGDGDGDGEDEDWIIRRKPSNPDKKKRSFVQSIWGLFG